MFNSHFLFDDGMRKIVFCLVAALCLISIRVHAEEYKPEPPSLGIEIGKGAMSGCFTKDTSLAADLTFFYQKNENGYYGYFEDGFGNVYSFQIDIAKKKFKAKALVIADERLVAYLEGEKNITIDKNKLKFEWKQAPEKDD